MCERTPKSIDTVIEHLEAISNESKKDDPLKFEQGQQVVEKLLRLKYELMNNKEIRQLEDKIPDLGVWNKRLYEEASGQSISYLDASMMFSECLIYRSISGIMSNFSRWEAVDAFEISKKSSFRSCLDEVRVIAKNCDTLFNLSQSNEKETFLNMLHICLWGNKSDLAFFVNVQSSDINKVLSMDLEAIKNMEKNIAVNHQEAVWSKASKLSNGRVDIVLDNSGFELFTDLLFADYLLQKGYASKVYFHGKTIPWFVSDTTLPDLKWILEYCLNDSNVELQILATRWMRYLRNGKLNYETDWFWTSPYTFWHLPYEAPNLYQKLAASDMIVFKGDLNYRKLIGDGKWESATKFHKAIGPLNAKFDNKKLPFIVALKTCKSELLPGIDSNRIKELDSIDKGWRTNGQYGIIQTNIES
ncbi:DUF89-domain-containing protein [Neoconidiobolus thromboides FSU 785]|nr:DUF89-domain-containing protein [Neoconidiobolus thromboides FSU 785]